MAHRFSGHHPKSTKVAAIAAVYKSGDSIDSLAEKLSALTGEGVNRGAVGGFYARNRKLLWRYPLRTPQAVQKAMAARRARQKNGEQRAKAPRRRDDNKLVVPKSLTGPIPKEVEALSSREGHGDSLRVPTLQLTAKQCRWSTHYDPEKGHQFCGHQQNGKSQYCEKHYDRSICKGTAWAARNGGL